MQKMSSNEMRELAADIETELHRLVRLETELHRIQAEIQNDPPRAELFYEDAEV
jgi:hypothetical protein